MHLSAPRPSPTVSSTAAASSTTGPTTIGGARHRPVRSCCRSFSTGDLVALTRHANPRVRTIALVRLFAAADHRLLPAIFALTTDTSPTYPSHTPVAIAYTYPPVYRETPKTPQTVGEVAEQMMRFYFDAPGIRTTSVGTSGCPGFDDYWQKRKDRTALASWLIVETDRATQGTSSIFASRAPKFRGASRSHRTDRRRRSPLVFPPCRRE